MRLHWKDFLWCIDEKKKEEVDNKAYVIFKDIEVGDTIRYKLVASLFAIGTKLRLNEFSFVDDDGKNLNVIPVGDRNNDAKNNDHLWRSLWEYRYDGIFGIEQDSNSTSSSTDSESDSHTD